MPTIQLQSKLLGAQIETTGQQIAILTRKISEVSDKRDDLKSTLHLATYSDPKLTNDTQRKLQAELSLAQSKEYRELTREWLAKRQLKDELAAKLERLRASMKLSLLDREAELIDRRAELDAQQESGLLS
jgi:hypothetical protein